MGIVLDRYHHKVLAKAEADAVCCQLDPELAPGPGKQHDVRSYYVYERGPYKADQVRWITAADHTLPVLLQE